MSKITSANLTWTEKGVSIVTNTITVFIPRYILTYPIVYEKSTETMRFGRYAELRPVSRTLSDSIFLQIRDQRPAFRSKTKYAINSPSLVSPENTSSPASPSCSTDPVPASPASQKNRCC